MLSRFVSKSLLVVATACAMALPFAGCSSSATAPASTVDAGAEAEAEPKTFGGARPVTVKVPDGYTAAKPAPLVVMLHGYSSTPGATELYFRMSGLADAHGFFYVAPSGTMDSKKNRFWNATDACCDMDHTGVDDVGYITSLVKEIQAAYAIDPRRIYVMGHSNGGFMTHRLACDRADIFAAGASFAGAVWLDPGKCNPSAPVGMLQIHGTKDESVDYAGLAGVYPSATETVSTWAKKNGCAEATTDGGSLHVTADGTGQETLVTRHEGCTKNGGAELWTIPNAPHVIVFTPESLEAIWKFFEAHAKPE
jgi:polyhydroxybutyrate depolymerase